MKFIPAVVVLLVGLSALSAADLPVRRYGAEEFHFPGTPCAAALSPDGKRLAVMSQAPYRSAGFVTIFDADTGRVVLATKTTYQDGTPFATTDVMAFSPDGKRVAVAFNSEATFVLDVGTGREVWRSKVGEKNPHPFVAFDPQGRLIRGFDHETRVYNLDTNQVTTWPVGGIAKVTPDGKTYVRTKKIYAEVEIGDAATGRPRHVLPLRTAHNGAENGYALSHDGRTLAVVHSVSELHLVDIATGATRRSWALPMETLSATNAEFAMAFSSDDRTLLLSTRGRTLQWNLETFQERPNVKSLRRQYGSRWRLSVDGKTIFLCREGVVDRCDAATGKAILPTVPGAGEPFTLTPDGKQIIASDRDGRVGVWTVATGAFERVLDIPSPAEQRLLTLAVSPNGRHLAYHRYASDFEVVPLNDRPTAAYAPPIIGPRTWNDCVLAWSPDSRHVYGYQSSVVLNRRDFVQYDVANKKIVQTISGRHPLALTPDGRELIVLDTVFGENGGIVYERPQLFRHDLAKNERVGPVALDRRWEYFPMGGLVAVNATGATLAIAFRHQVYLAGTPVPPFDATNPYPPYGDPERFAGRDRPAVTSLAFSPGGQWLVTSGEDYAVKVWEVATGKLVKRFEGPDLVVAQVAVAGNGRSAFSAGPDGFIEEWDLTPPVHPKLPKTAADLWTAANSSDAALGASAAWALMADDKLRADTMARLSPVAKPDAAQVAKWIADLDAAAFADRTTATKELAALSRTVELPLREALKATSSTEVRERLEALIARFDKKLSPEEVRAMRLVHAAEWHRAKEPLTVWASGSPSAVLTREATAALARLK